MATEEPTNATVHPILYSERQSKEEFRLRWTRSSSKTLEMSEAKLLKRISRTKETSFVPIFGNNAQIRTVIIRPPKSMPLSLPLVLLHGFASGAALWCKNFDVFAASRTVYAIDVLGFGRSSRPDFPKDPIDAENLFIQSIEEWRQAIKLDRFILLGHSLGGYLASGYTMKYSNRVEHLILAEPWGFLEAPVNPAVINNLTPTKLWFIRTVQRVLQPKNPLALLRAAGPLGLRAMHRLRGDLAVYFDQYPNVLSRVQEAAFELQSTDLSAGSPYVRPESDSCLAKSSSGHGEPRPMARERRHSDSALLPSALPSFHNDARPWPWQYESNDDGTVVGDDDNEEDDAWKGSVAIDYCYHINVQKPSGEVGFRSLCANLGWAKRPMLDRIVNLDPGIGISFIYGSRSWLDMSAGFRVRALRPKCFVDVKIIEGAGHQLYAQTSDEFNAIVVRRLIQVDQHRARHRMSSSTSKASFDC